MSMKCITIDIESNGLLGDMVDFSSFPYKLKNDARIWCISFTDVETMETKSLVGADITKNNIDDILKPYNFIIQHNGIKFDLLALKLFGLLDYRIGYLNESDELNGRDVRFIDTMILSRLIAPDRFGGHSLESWGKRLGDFKTDFRQQCIDAGIIDKKDPKGAEFKKFTPLMVPYCEQDTIVTAKIFLHLLPEFQEYSGWKQAFKMETKLADLAIRRESLGFWFDKDLALFCLEDLTNKMNELRDKVNPLLPPKPMGKTDLNYHTPPATQITKSGKLSSHIVKFTERHGGEILKEGDKFFMSFPWAKYELPFNLPIKTTVEADISHLDHVKQVLIDHGWEPTEWKERDITKDTKKVSLPPEKRLQVFERWLKETLEGKYKKHRLELTFELHKVKSVVELKEKITKQIESEFPIRVITSPPIRVGVEKELCPNLLALGDKVAFAKDFALYLTYKHRKSSIAGGDIEDMDLDDDVPNSGFLSLYRESDGRVPTPSIEIGANTGRYKHIGVCNIARPSSIYGKEMRSLFGCGGDAVQFGFDYASLEARIQSHYCWNYTDGEELAVSLLAEKPNDIHSVTGRKLGIPRSDAKSVNYMLMYGGSWVKAKKMLNLTDEGAKDIVNRFWESMPALKELKQYLEAEWEATGGKYIIGIDGRKLNVRSKHSIINLLFQSGGVVCAKYVSVMIMEKFEKLGFCIDPFISKPDICSMLEYHDEQQLYVNKDILKFKTFETEDEAKKFVDSWKDDQLSDISYGKKYYVTLPSVISKTIDESIKEMGNLLKLNIPLGYAYSVSNNWYGCH